MSDVARAQPGDLVRVKPSRLVISNLHNKIGIFLGSRCETLDSYGVLIENEIYFFSQVGCECIERIDETG